MHSPTGGDADIRCDSDEALAAAQDLMSSASPIIIATPGTAGWDIKWRWVQPLGYTPTNPGGIVAYPHRHLTIQFDSTSQPAIVVIGNRSFDDVEVEFAGFSFDDMDAIWATFRDSETDTRIP